MGLFDGIFGGKKNDSPGGQGLIGYGKDKKNGGHNHQTNKGPDRTPAQIKGDEKRRKP